MQKEYPQKNIYWPWRGYLAFAILLVLILMGGIYSLWVSRTITKQAEGENLAADLAQAISGAEFIADHQKGLMDRLRAIALRNRFQTAVINRDFSEIRSILRPLIHTNDEVKTIFLADNSGYIFIGLPHLVDKTPVKRMLPLDGIKPWVSPVVSGNGKQGNSLVVFSVPIFDAQKKLIGFVGLTQKGWVWKDFFARISARPGRTFYLYDQKGTLVASGLNANALAGLGLNSLSQPSKIKPITIGKPWAGIVSNSKGKAFVTAALVPKLNWLLVVAQDYEAGMSSSRAMTKSIVFFLLLLFICLLMLGFMLFSRYRVQQQVLTRLGGEVKKRTEDLEYSTLQYRSLVEDLPDIVYEIDADYRYTFVSNSVSAILGYKPEELVGRLRRDSIYWSDLAKFDEEKKRSEQGQEISILALRHTHKNGEVRWLSVHSRGIFNKKGQVIGRRGVARDVTQQVLAESRVRELSRMLIKAQEEERKRIALDLHDEMGQLLSALKIGLQALVKRPQESDSPELLRLIRLAQQIMDRIRALAHRLRPSILDNFGLKAAIEDLCETFAESDLLDVEYYLDDLDKKAVSNEVQIALFRVAQESLTNVVKHSESRRVLVRLLVNGKNLDLAIRDFGKGFNVDEAMAEGRQLGLLGMQERIILIGGHLKIQSNNAGTTISASVTMGE